MKLKFPLYGQILLWFFLNLTLVTIALYLICSVIFGMDIRTVVHDAVEGRIVAAGREVSNSLREAPGEEWDEIIAGYGKKYGVKFSLYHPNGDQILDEEPELPKDILTLLENENLKPPTQGRPDAPGEKGGGPPRLRGDGGGPEGGGPGRDRARGPRPGGRVEDPGFPRPRPPRGGEGSAEPPRGQGGPGYRDSRTPPRPRMVFYKRTGSPEEYWAGVWVPLFNSEYRHPIDGVLIAKSPRLQDNGIFVNWKPWLWPLLAVLGISALIWLPFVHGLARRLRRLTAVAEAISEGEFDVTAPSRRSDEIGRLSRAIRRMALRLDTFVTGQKRFLGDTAHELCSPLARIRLHLGLLEREIPDAQRERLGELETEVEELSQLVNELLAFSKASLKPASLPVDTINLLSLVSELADREAAGCEIRYEVSPSTICSANREFTRRAVGNLLKNAVRYAGEAGPITITAQEVSGGIELSIVDEGPGIAPEWLEAVLEPFARPELARTREGGGVGLGLAIAKTCIEAMGGRIELQNGREKGLIATLTFPSGLQTNANQTS